MVDVFAVAPPVHTALLLQVREVNVSARNESLSREISDHVQSVSAASAQLLFPIHRLTVTVTQALLVAFLWAITDPSIGVQIINVLKLLEKNLLKFGEEWR